MSHALTWLSRECRLILFAVALSLPGYGIEVLRGEGPRPIGLIVALGFNLLFCLGLRALPAALIGAAFALSYNRLTTTEIITVCLYALVYTVLALLLRRWITSETSQNEVLLKVVLAGGLLAPLASTTFNYFILRYFYPVDRFDFSVSTPVFVFLSWVRESAAIVSLSPAFLIHFGPRLRRWMGTGTEATVRLTDAQVIEVVLQSSIATCAMTLGVLVKREYGLNMTYLAFLSLFSCARHGIGTASATIAVAVLCCSAAWMQFQWVDVLGVGEFRILVLSSSLTTILLALLVERQNRTKAELDELAIQLRSLAAHNKALHERESVLISKTIHDDLAPSLLTLRAQIQEASPLQVETEPEIVKTRLQAAAKSVDSIISSVRRVATDLRPGVLDSLGLDAAVEWLAKDFEIRTEIPCRVTQLQRIDARPERGTVVFRVAQEVLEAVAQNPRLEAVSIALRQDERFVELSIIQHGKELNSSWLGQNRSLELLAWRERVSQVGGRLKIESLTDNSVRVCVEIACD